MLHLSLEIIFRKKNLSLETLASLDDITSRCLLQKFPANSGLVVPTFRAAGSRVWWLSVTVTPR
jgi:hypothetical protein